jgi:hypothetical protein
MLAPRRCDIELHIGLAKTGTTAVQAYLAANRSVLLERHDVLFPASLGRQLSSHLAAACQQSARPDDLRKKRGLLTPESVDRYREALAGRLADEIDRERPERLVISCEHFTSRLHSEAELACLKDFLNPFARSIRVWIYLRRQDELVRSAYSTAIRSGGTSPFRWPKAGRERPDLHFDRLLDRWTRTFPDGAVHVRLYDRARLAGNDIVADFCDALALPGDLARPGARSNTSLDAQSLDFLRRFNARVPYFNGDSVNILRGDINRAVDSYGKRASQAFNPVGAESFYARFVAGNRYVRQRFFPGRDDLPENLFEAPQAEAEARAEGPLPRDELIGLTAHVWTHAQIELQREQARSATLTAELALERGQVERAQQLLAAVVERHPDFAGAWSALAALARRQGNESAAREHARRALELAADKDTGPVPRSGD